MNINEILTNNITIVVAVIIVLIVVSVIITFMLLKATEVKYNELELQNAKLNEQVKTYTNNLARLYEQERYIDEEADNTVTQSIPAPDVDAINSMNNMSVPSVPVQQEVPVQSVQSVQTVQQPVQSQNETVTVDVSTHAHEQPAETHEQPEQDIPK